MKKILAIIGVAALLATVFTMAVNAQNGAPTYGYVNFVLPPILATGTTNYAVNLYTNAPSIYCGKQQNVAVELTSTASSANGATNVFFFGPSMDNTFFDTNAADAVTFTNAVLAGGSGTNTSLRTFNSGGFGYYKCWQIVTTAQASGLITNYVQGSGFSQKLSSP